MTHALILSCLLALAATFPGFAHELEATAALTPPAVVVRARYGGSEPVAFVKVQVLAPQGSPVEYQNGLTDRNGQFSFVPDGPGAWRVLVDDEEGHRRELTVSVPSPFEGAAANAAPAPDRWMRVLTGLSLMVGLTGFLYGWKSRRG
ncbi:MAG: hypothetical protein IPJ98_05130 [Bryobacterales bacterium]|nr:hypothetical protein [Bryobacterales bacterium]